MRNKVVETIYRLMEKDRNIYFLTGDLGYNALEKLKDFGERFVNCGIAEQNMMGVAAGLAKLNKKVFVYSIIPFATLRCLEQIRNDICFHNLDVTILGMGAGLYYGVLGKSHFAVEDLGMMRLLPNMKVLIPSGKYEAEKIIEEIYKVIGPSYLSISKASELEKEIGKYKLGDLREIKKGEDIVIFSCGNLVWEIVEGANNMEKKYGISAEIVNIPCLNPINDKQLFRYTKDKKMIFVIDEHTINGGIGSLVTEILCKQSNAIPCKFFTLPKELDGRIGDRNYLWELYGLSKNIILERIVKEMCL